MVCTLVSCRLFLKCSNITQTLFISLEKELNPWPNENAVESKSFQFGNYSRYYGYRTNDPKGDDPRLKFFSEDMLRNKLVLDLGCNTGNVTISIAKQFSPKHIFGVDIDPSLITSANHQLKMLYLKPDDKKRLQYLKNYIGDLKGLPFVDLQSGNFPNNVSFHTANCVPKLDEKFFEPAFDCILALSLTKWIHMNFGDSGLKRLFLRIYSQLKPNGIFILEPQPWSSYKKKSKRNEHTKNVYKMLEFKPEQFEEFLLQKVGFSSCESLGTPNNESKGFQRPLILFRK